MAQSNRISIVIASEVHQEAMTKIADCRNLLKPFLHPLSLAERATLVKMGDRTKPFVQKALDYAKINADFLPPSINREEWQKDLEGWEDLVAIKNQLNQLLSDLDDTIMLLGAEAYDPARWYYNLAKQAANRGDSSAKPIVDDLSQRFAGNGHKKANTGNTTN